ncbi:LuxR family transcriptional regulator [Mycobacterium sp. NAZ190054]|nr:LuxR family transcriptional regulator [Mycobacterium sp. NAZ190054]
MGKTALLDAVASRVPDWRVARVTGVESETEFAYAALHHLCVPFSEHLDRIPDRQRDALATAFGRRQGATPDPFLVGLAALNVVSESAQQGPVLLLVDDQQWLDRASSLATAFVARRLAAERVGVVFATRTAGPELRGLAELAIGGLREDDSQALLARGLDGPLDARVRDRIVVEARGNPLALLQIPRSLDRAALAGGFGEPGMPLTHSLEGALRKQIHDLPLRTRRLLALAAAEPSGDASAMWRAAELLGIEPDAAVAAMEAGLAEIGSRVTFRHPLIRSTAYRSVPLSDRQAIHGALATVIDRELDPERRAWHLGYAAVGPDEAVAEELERCASRVGARGGIAAAAAFLERASALTADPARRGDRAVAAAEAKAQAGVLDDAKDLLRLADAAPLTERQRAQADLVRAQLAFISSHGNDAAPLLLAAARRWEAVDAGLARETYLDAMSAALFAGRLASEGDMSEVSEAAGAALRALGAPAPADLLLDGLATQYSGGFQKGLPTLQKALSVYGEGMSAGQEMRWMLLACLAASRVWDIDRHASLSRRYLQLVRESGSVSHLPLALSAIFIPLLYTGDFDEAAHVTEEMCAAIDAMGNNLSPYSAIVLAAWRGRRAELRSLSAATRRDAERRGEGHGLTVIVWAEAVMAVGHCEYQAARDAAADACSHPGDGGASWWALAELVESSVRLDDFAAAHAALDQLVEMTTPSGTDWGLGIEARCRALVSDDGTAEPFYLEAVERLGRAGLRPELGRAHLLYGEWLRRQRRRLDARNQLRAAQAVFDTVGMEAFAERARRELLATGETARRRNTTPAVTSLTPQEAQVARLAREGLSNPEIGARLFISARTVQYHLGKVFTKLGIRSRSQLEHALAERENR